MELEITTDALKVLRLPLLAEIWKYTDTQSCDHQADHRGEQAPWIMQT